MSKIQKLLKLEDGNRDAEYVLLKSGFTGRSGKGAHNVYDNLTTKETVILSRHGD